MFGMTFGMMGAGRARIGQFVLDQIAAATAAAYSTRRLSSQYNGPALRVRRSSDSVEADIGFNADGTLNETALLAHVGANSGFVSKYYDQSGNGRDMAQATAASQPRIVNAGVIDRLNAKPAILTDGVSQAMKTASFVLAQPFCRASVIKFNSNAVSKHFLNNTAGADVAARINASGGLIMGAGVDLVLNPAVSAGDAAVIVESYNGTSSMGTYNGAISAGNAGTNPLNGVVFGGWVGGTGGFSNGTFADILIFPIALDPTTRANLEANQKQFWGTP